MSRRLAAIMAVDVAGFSALMARDERATMAALKAVRAQCFQPEVDAHGGRVVKYMGDGALVEFASAVDAVDCALAVQTAMSARQVAPHGVRIDLRIGVHIGDVLVEGGDLYGDGVNVAARIEALAEPRTVLVSAQVQDMVASKLPVAFIDEGERKLAKLDRPVHLYRVERVDSALGPGGAPQRVDPIMQRPAVAVLPFTNRSGDADQDYFADGLSEDLITALAAWRSFPVIARSSSFTYKGRSVAAPQVGNELGARYVIEGSVRRSGNRVRVSAQFIDAENGVQLWAEHYDRELEDVFAIQDDITRRIVAVIEPHLQAAELQRTQTSRTGNLSAWDCFLRGWSAVHDYTCAGNAAARQWFRQALELEPGYSDAWMGLGRAHLLDMVVQGCTDDRAATLEAGLAAARHAVLLDGSSSFAHLTLGMAYVYGERFDEGIAETETAVQLNPSNAHAQMALGNRLDLVGRTAEAVERLESALWLNPRDPLRALYLGYLSRARLALGLLEPALAAIGEAVRLRPSWPVLHYRHAAVLAHLDRPDAARLALAECERLEPGFVAGRRSWRPYADDTRNAHFFAGLKRHGLIDYG